MVFFVMALLVVGVSYLFSALKVSTKKEAEYRLTTERLEEELRMAQHEGSELGRALESVEQQLEETRWCNGKCKPH